MTWSVAGIILGVLGLFVTVGSVGLIIGMLRAKRPSSGLAFLAYAFLGLSTVMFTIASFREPPSPNGPPHATTALVIAGVLVLNVVLNWIHNRLEGRFDAQRQAEANEPRA